jgi:hypothetical protein
MYKHCRKRKKSAMLEGSRAITVRQAARVAKCGVSTIRRWILAGYLYVAPKWGREVGDRVFLAEVLDCIPKGRRHRRSKRYFRCPKDRVWYKSQIDRTRFRRLLETEGEREKRLAWQRTYQRQYVKRKKELNA